MANITEVSQWENVIRQLENGEAATGGADGLANVQAKQLANRTKWLKENCLPLTGGAVSGTIRQKVDNSCVVLWGGSQELTGANLLIFGNENEVNPGNFYVKTGYTDGEHCEFIAKPNGDLTWNRNYPGGGIKTDIAGSAIVAKSLGTNGYVKYASGMIIQWGECAGNSTVTLPVSFTTYYISVACSNDFADRYIGAKHISLSQLQINVSANADKYVNWLAIGY